MDVRIVAPKHLWPKRSSSINASNGPPTSGARITLTDQIDEGVKGADFVHTDVWVSMGEPIEVWGERIKLLLPYQVNRTLLRHDRQSRRQVHALPARVPQC